VTSTDLKVLAENLQQTHEALSCVVFEDIASRSVTLLTYVNVTYLLTYLLTDERIQQAVNSKRPRTRLASYF